MALEVRELYSVVSILAAYGFSQSPTNPGVFFKVIPNLHLVSQLDKEVEDDTLDIDISIRVDLSLPITSVSITNNPAVLENGKLIIVPYTAAIKPTVTNMIHILSEIFEGIYDPSSWECTQSDIPYKKSTIGEIVCRCT